MISVLTLADFQSHASTRLELGRFTAVVGPSSSGKSSLVRALKVLALNSRGTPYVRSGAKAASVSALSQQFEGDPAEAGIGVRVRRGPGVSEYYLSIPGQDEQIFTKCGSSAPPLAIQGALDFGFDSLWLAGQFDAPFLLDETGTAVAKVLGDLTNVSMIYAAAREVGRRLSSTRAKLTDRAEQLRLAREVVWTFSDLPARLQSMAQLEESLLRLEHSNRRTATVQSLSDTVRRCTDELTAAQTRVKEVPSLSDIRGLATKRANLGESVSALRRAADSLRSTQAVAVPSLQEVRAAGERRRVLLQLTAATSFAMSAKITADKSVVSGSEDLSSARSELAEALQRAGRCPLCGAEAVHARIE